MVKTREKLIEVARQLFAKTGVENTTMNDIAAASEKGRRTLYTYFKSKTEIYNAVIESELNVLCHSLEVVAHRNLPADKKLLEFIRIRFESIKDVVFRNGTLKADFFRDIWRVEYVRKSFDLKEITFIEEILKDGINQGMFEIEDAHSMATVLHHALKGLEVPYIRGMMRDNASSSTSHTNSIVHLLFNGIKKKT